MRNVSVYKCENIVKWALDICDHEKLLKFSFIFMSMKFQYCYPLFSKVLALVISSLIA